jgi:hypothetical protein
MNNVTHCQRCISGITIVRLKVGDGGQLIYDVNCDNLIASLYVTKSGAGSVFQNLFNRASLSSSALGDICNRIATATQMEWQKFIDELANQGVDPPPPGSEICVTFDLGQDPVCFQITQDHSTGFIDVTQSSGTLAGATLTAIPCP